MYSHSFLVFLVQFFGITGFVEIFVENVFCCSIKPFKESRAKRDLMYFLVRCVLKFEFYLWQEYEEDESMKTMSLEGKNKFVLDFVNLICF